MNLFLKSLFFPKTRKSDLKFYFKKSFFLILKNQIYNFFQNLLCFLIKQSDLNFSLGGSFYSLIKKSDLGTLFKNSFLIILKNHI